MIVGWISRKHFDSGIYLQWPSSSAWAIDTLVGVSMIISGVTRVMLSLAVRKAAFTHAMTLPTA